MIRKSTEYDVRRSRLRIAVLILTLWLGCFYGLDAVGLFDLDEGLYATASRRMVDSGDWLVPYVGTEVFFDKPPLTYWLQGAAIELMGATPTAARLPSAVAAAFTALGVMWWARRRGLSRIGRPAAIIFVLSPLTIALARQAITDSLLTLWLTISIIGWIEGYLGNRRWYLLMAAGAGLATMTKGPIGLLLPGAAFVIWTFVRRDFKEWRRVPWLAAIGLYLLIVLPWHVAVWRACGDAFVQEYIVHQQLARFLGKDFAHNSPFWFYIPILLIGAFPWSAFLPGVWWNNLKIRSCDKQSADCGISMWALWAAVVLVFFSLSKSKLPGYMQPVMPALALLVAARLSKDVKSTSRLENILLGVVGVLVGGIFTAAGIFGKLWQSQPEPILFDKPVAASVVEPLSVMYLFALSLGLLFLLGTIAIIISRRQPKRITYIAMLFGIGFVVLAGSIGLPAWNSYNIEPLHSLARKTIPALNRGERLIIYAFPRNRPSIRFVVGHPKQVIDVEDVRALRRIFQNGTGGYILAPKDANLSKLPNWSVTRESSAGQWVLWRVSEMEYTY